jgi:O-antigen ligase
MPLAYIPKFIFFWLLSFVVYIIYNYEDFKPFSKKNIPNLFLLAFYLWSVITVIYSENKLLSFDLLERRLVFLVLPILLLFNTQLAEKRKYLIYFFIIGNFFSIAICVISFLNTGLWGNEEARQIHFYTAVNNFKHYNYIGLDLSIGLLLLLYLFKNKKISYQLAVLIPTALVYTLFIFLSQARMSLLTILLASIIILINRIIHYEFYKIGAVIVIAALILIPIILTKNSRLNIHLDSQEVSIKDIDVNRDNLWRESVKLVKQRPILGYGIGDKSITLEDHISYNSHNQILDFFLDGGIISNILFWLFWIWLFIIKPPKSIKFYSISISSIFFIALLTESLLNRIAGISLFVFIYYLFENTEGNKIPEKISKLLNIILLSLILLVFILIVPVSYLTLKKVDFDPKQPRTYAQRSLNQVPYFSLPGFLPDGIVKGTNGYKLDSTSNSVTWGGNAYSYTKVANPVLNETDSLSASVYCYVSVDFDGTWVRISSEGGSSVSNTISKYNLNNKGTWQKLQISPICNEGKVPIYLYIAKYNCTSFDSLKGYVIFAYPEVKVITTQKINDNSTLTH